MNQEIVSTETEISPDGQTRIVRQEIHEALTPGSLRVLIRLMNEVFVEQEWDTKAHMFVWGDNAAQCIQFGYAEAFSKLGVAAMQLRITDTGREFIENKCTHCTSKVVWSSV